MRQSGRLVLDTHRWKRGIQWLIGQSIDLAFPPHCAFCRIELPRFPTTENGEASNAGENRDANNRTPAPGMLCSDCRQDLAQPAQPVCVRCGAGRIGLPAADGSCSHCRGVEFRFSRVVALGSYRDELRQAVLRMKHSGSEPLSIALSGLFSEVRGAALRELKPDVIMPVPMHWRRRLSRGVNSPETLATSLGRRMRLPVTCRTLVRRRSTRPQSELRPDERAANIRGAFRLVFPRKVRGRRVLLVDDILTTGATAQEAARVLLDGGASAVAVAIIARADGTQ